MRGSKAEDYSLTAGVIKIRIKSAAYCFLLYNVFGIWVTFLCRTILRQKTLCRKGDPMKYQCLIIDDEKMLADSTAEYFNLFGINTVAVYSVEDCRKFFKDKTAELILLDINLGDGNGFELCKELRETTNITILFISARTSDDDKIVDLNIGGDDYVKKQY